MVIQERFLNAAQVTEVIGSVLRKQAAEVPQVLKEPGFETFEELSAPQVSMLVRFFAGEYVWGDLSAEVRHALINVANEDTPYEPLIIDVRELLSVTETQLVIQSLLGMLPNKKIINVESSG